MLFVIFAKVPGVPETVLLLYLMPLFNTLSLITTEKFPFGFRSGGGGQPGIFCVCFTLALFFYPVKSSRTGFAGFCNRVWRLCFPWDFLAGLGARGSRVFCQFFHLFVMLPLQKFKALCKNLKLCVFYLFWILNFFIMTV